jgi:hypothetical protein
MLLDKLIAKRGKDECRLNSFIATKQIIIDSLQQTILAIHCNKT